MVTPDPAKPPCKHAYRLVRIAGKRKQRCLLCGHTREIKDSYNPAKGWQLKPPEGEPGHAGLTPSN